MFLLIVAAITVLILLDVIPPRQEHCNCIKYTGIRVSVAEFEVDYGVSLSAP